MMARLGLLLALGLLAACNKTASAPVGQVVATVDGREITASELNLELAGAPRQADAKAQKALEAAALQSIVNRRLAARAARAEKLDATPEFAMQRNRAEEMALIGALEAKLSAAVPTPSREEAERYVAEHPDSYGQRKLFVVDQLVVPALDGAALQAMQPLKTLAEIGQMLERRGIPYQRAVGAVDGATSDATMVSRVAALPSGEAFVVRNGNGAVVNMVRDTRIEPFVGARAVDSAQAMLKQRRVQEIVGKQISQMIADGAKTVQYNAAYAPPKPAAAPAGKP